MRMSWVILQRRLPRRSVAEGFEPAPPIVPCVFRIIISCWVSMNAFSLSQITRLQAESKAASTQNL